MTETGWQVGRVCDNTGACDCALERILMFGLRMLKLCGIAVCLGIGMAVFKEEGRSGFAKEWYDLPRVSIRQTKLAGQSRGRRVGMTRSGLTGLSGWVWVWVGFYASTAGGVAEWRRRQMDLGDLESQSEPSALAVFRGRS